MQLTRKSKHNNSTFKKWTQIPAGENSSGATTERRIEIQREQQRRRRQQQIPQQREHCFAKRRSRRQETQGRLQRLQTCTDSCNCRIFSLFLYPIQFCLNAYGQNAAITMRTKPMKRGNCRRFEKMPPTGFATTAIRRGAAFPEVL